jgi:hypothetical protein
MTADCMSCSADCSSTSPPLFTPLSSSPPLPSPFTSPPLPPFAPPPLPPKVFPPLPPATPLRAAPPARNSAAAACFCKRSCTCGTIVFVCIKVSHM